MIEGGIEEAGLFQKVPQIDDSRLAEVFTRVTSRFPRKGQFTVRYFGLYADANRGKVQKAIISPYGKGNSQNHGANIDTDFRLFYYH